MFRKIISQQEKIQLFEKEISRLTVGELHELVKREEGGKLRYLERLRYWLFFKSRRKFGTKDNRVKWNLYKWLKLVRIKQERSLGKFAVDFYDQYRETDHDGILNEFGMIFKFLGDWEHAYQCFSKVVKEDCNNIMILDDVIKVMRNTGRPAEAIHYLKRKLKLVEEKTDVYFILGMIQADSGEDKEAKKYFEQAKEYACLEQKAYSLVDLARIYIDRPAQPVEAKECLQKAKEIAADKNIRKLWHKIGVGYLVLLKDPDQAIACLEKISDQDIPTRDSIAKAYRQKGEYKKAVKIYKNILKERADDILAHYGLGLCYKEINKYAKAIKKFKEMLTILKKADKNRLFYIKGEGMAYYGLALTYEKMGRGKDALENFNRSLKIRPYDKQVYKGLGFFYERKEDFEQALENFKKALGIDPHDEGARRGYQRLLEKLSSQERSPLDCK